MTVEAVRNENELVLYIEGKIDTITSPQLEQAIKDNLEEETKLVTLDFKQVSIISSTGIRVLLQTHRIMTKGKGRMVLRNMNDVILEALEITGFIGEFEIEY